jgi:folate-binding protein YgfZ
VDRKIISFDVSDRPLIEFAGTDRAKSLQNLTTQDVKVLTPGQSTEGFVTSPQGKTIGFFTIHVFDESILLRCEPDGAADALAHFAKYTIFDDATCELMTDRYEQKLWLGIESLRDVFDRIGSPEPAAVDRSVKFDLPETGPVSVVPYLHYGVPGVLLITTHGAMARAEAELIRLTDIKPEPGNYTQLERLRVLAGWPRYGADIKSDNLPQEIDRDATAISFRKGCYLGQETVARLDALGHVNRILRGFVYESDEPVSNTEALIGRALVNEAGQAVGEIRSVTQGNASNQAVGMVMVRVKALENAILVEGESNSRIKFSTLEDYRNQFRTGIASVFEKA